MIAPGYLGAWAAIVLGLFYGALHTFESLSFMFFFFSGLMAARRELLRAPLQRSGTNIDPAEPHTPLDNLGQHRTIRRSRQLQSVARQ
jgi:hypothetical protein